jgi:hypothetical protein
MEKRIVNSKKLSPQSWIAPFLFFLIVLSACSPGAVETAPEYVTPATSTEKPTEAPEEQVTATQQEPTEVTLTLATEAPKEEIKPLVILQQHVFHSSRYGAVYAFLIENPNQESYIANSIFQVDAFDANNNLLDTRTIDLSPIPPGETFGVSGPLITEGNNTFSRVEVITIDEGEPLPATSNQIANFEISDLQYGTSLFGYIYASAIIKNPSGNYYSWLNTSVLFFDESGEIVGAAYKDLSFINPTSSSGLLFRSNLTDADVKDSSITPVVNVQYYLDDQRGIPDDASELTVIDYGFSPKDDDFSFGVLINNPNQNYAVEFSLLTMTVYGLENRVLFTEEYSIPVLTPNQTLGVTYSWNFAENDQFIDRIDIQLSSGYYYESDILPFFETENLSISNNRVLGTIKNPFAKDFPSLMVFALLHDDSGNIIGGSYGWFDFLAESNTNIEIPFGSFENVASAELYTSVNIMSDLQGLPPD